MPNVKISDRLYAIDKNSKRRQIPYKLSEFAIQNRLTICTLLFSQKEVVFVSNWFF